MPTPKQYRAKLFDIKHNKSLWVFDWNKTPPGILVIIGAGYCAEFIPDGEEPINMSPLQTDPVIEGNKISFATKNSNYIFEILEEVG